MKVSEGVVKLFYCPSGTRKKLTNSLTKPSDKVNFKNCTTISFLI